MFTYQHQISWLPIFNNKPLLCLNSCQIQGLCKGQESDNLEKNRYKLKKLTLLRRKFIWPTTHRELSYCSSTATTEHPDIREEVLHDLQKSFSQNKNFHMHIQVKKPKHGTPPDKYHKEEEKTIFLNVHTCQPA